MKCSTCKADNPDNKKFCSQCGAKLLCLCQQCGREVLITDKFCGECGQTLDGAAETEKKEQTFDEKLSAIQKYLPGGPTEKILSQKGRIEAERRQVTVLFADMENFTPLVEKLGSEEAYALMDQVYEILIHKVHELEGTVNEMTGDGIMALFGAPIALEDAPQRAIRSALAIHQEIARFSDRFQQQKDIPPIRMRIGIHTGPVVVGTLGNDLRVEFKAVGDTVNLASRLQGLADSGTILVSQETFDLTEGLFRFENQGEMPVKGKADVVRAYRVIAPSRLRTRFEVIAERGLTPIVGRSRELELLLEGFERVKEGHGQGFSIIGEAGIGKSRLLYEFRKAVANENVTFLEGKCLSYGRGSAYHPISDILKGAFGIEKEEDPSKIKNKVKIGLEALKADVPQTFPIVLELLGVKESGIEKIRISPEGKKDRIIETLKRIVLKSSENRPIIIAVEDLHWADKSTEDVLKYLLESIPGVSVFLVFTCRPEFLRNLSAQSYHNLLTLNRLSHLDSLTMTESLLGTTRVEKKIAELVLSRTEGVPFFIEEFIKTLKDLNIIRKEDRLYRLVVKFHDMQFPSTIQDVIMARVDGLPQDAKEILQTASAIEREFNYDLIKNVTGIDDTRLRGGLALLRKAELIYERGVFSDSRYLFKHVLTRDVVYGSLLAAKKKVLHAKIAKVIEAVNETNLEPFFSLLAEQFIASENYAKGVFYSKQAGKNALRKGSISEAISHLKRSVDCIECMPQSDEVQRQRIDARMFLAMNIAALNDIAEAKKTIQPIVDLALLQNHQKRVSQIYTILGSHSQYVTEDYPEAFKSFEKALKIAEETGDNATSCLVSNWYAIALGMDCQFELAAFHYQRWIQFLEQWKVDSMMATVQAVYTMWCHSWAGKVDMAYKNAHNALRLAQKSGDNYSTGFAYIVTGIACWQKGLLEEAKKYLNQGIETCKKSHVGTWIAVANVYLGEVYFELVEYDLAKKHYQESQKIWLRYGIFSSSWAVLGELGVMKSKVQCHEMQFDMESALELFQRNKVRMLEGWLARFITEILLVLDDRHFAMIDRWIQQQIETNRRNGTLFELGRAYKLYSEFYLKTGNPSGAREQLGNAIENMKECGADGWIEKYENDLSSLK